MAPTPYRETWGGKAGKAEGGETVVGMKYMREEFLKNEK